MKRVEGKVALVTGGAMGIGNACALLLAREGARVVVSDVDERDGAQVAREVAALTEGTFVAHGVASEAAWEAAIDQTLRRFGRLDVVVNNAGTGTTGHVEETTLESWRHLMSINCDGVFLGIKHAIRAMKASGGGSIINLSSILGLVGDAGAAAYSASKGAVRLLTKSAALHCARAGYRIRVNSVHPGYIVTPMVEHYLSVQSDPVAARKAIEALHPVGHLGEADDVAYGVLYLASDESRFVTGSELVIDGGYTAQ
ncbi:glucose 1-dehydrogenase [bacterium]|nr:MAG: glucose 1-dehydrogenase [bacterium]